MLEGSQVAPFMVAFSVHYVEVIVSNPRLASSKVALKSKTAS